MRNARARFRKHMHDECFVVPFSPVSPSHTPLTRYADGRRASTRLDNRTFLWNAHIHALQHYDWLTNIERKGDTTDIYIGFYQTTTPPLCSGESITNRGPRSAGVPLSRGVRSVPASTVRVTMCACSSSSRFACDPFVVH